ncbi:MAG: ribosome maturation factor RimM [Gammaproteobacteria bacterium]|nr:ribosome maturation factor RimM [Gammaproteobacteria bacterium]MDH5727722.1 ribosome maturation factor RimM [Gammaproteobacteria bacterium]
MPGSDEKIVLGQISGIYGVKGWVKVFSFTNPKENILDYKRWFISPANRSQTRHWQSIELIDGRRQGKGVIAQIKGYDDREQARLLMGWEIAVNRDDLPKLDADEYYWTDLEGLQVRNLDGVELGKIDHLFATGANDVIVVQGERERLIPFIQGQVIYKIDLNTREMIVDWSPED